MINHYLINVFKTGIQDTDSDEVKLQKTLLLVISVGTSVPGFIWGWIYLVFGEPIASLIPLTYSVIGFIIFLLYRQNPENYRFYFFSIRLMILIVPFILFLALGGFILSSVAIVWSIMAPLTTLLTDQRKQAWKWFAVFVLFILIGVIFPPVRSDNSLPGVLIRIFFFLNIFGMSVTTFAMILFTVNERAKFMELLELEKDRSEKLLLNVLPAEVIPHLQKSKEAYVEEFDSVSVLFADIVGFTGLTEKYGARKMLDLLNEIYSYFDSLLSNHKAEKIRTIGDNYMVAVGAPVREKDHAFLMVSMAQKMLDYLDKPETKKRGINFRIGINSGPVVAGVIGRHKFHFDIWGDMVNVASRFESHGLPGRIQIGKETHRLLNNRIQTKSRGAIEIKGKSKIETWLVE
ncbi:MAG: adenylate/guanylate cyclase domain-containing protein [Candidatus Hodarchaeales archaeon]